MQSMQIARVCFATPIQSVGGWERRLCSRSCKLAAKWSGGRRRTMVACEPRLSEEEHGRLWSGSFRAARGTGEAREQPERSRGTTVNLHSLVLPCTRAVHNGFRRASPALQGQAAHTHPFARADAVASLASRLSAMEPKSEEQPEASTSAQPEQDAPEQPAEEATGPQGACHSSSLPHRSLNDTRMHTASNLLENLSHEVQVRTYLLRSAQASR